MKLWILRPVKEWQPWYDSTFGVVVRAGNAKKARKLATSAAGDEGKEVWLDKEKTTCKEIKEDGKEEVIIVDYHSA